MKTETRFIDEYMLELRAEYQKAVITMIGLPCHPERPENHWRIRAEFAADLDNPASFWGLIVVTGGSGDYDDIWLRLRNEDYERYVDILRNERPLRAQITWDPEVISPPGSPIVSFTLLTVMETIGDNETES